MKRGLKYIAAVALLGMASCSTDGVDSSVTPDAGTSQVTFKSSIATRLDGGGFAESDAIALYAYSTDDSGVEANDWYTYSYGSDGIFTSSTNALEVTSKTSVDYTAVFPASAVNTSALNFSVKTNQSAEADYYASDLLIAEVSDATPQPTLTFEHMNSSLIVDVEFFDKDSGAALEINVTALTFSADATVTSADLTSSTELSLSASAAVEITPYQPGDDTYRVIIPAQEFTSSSPIATLTTSDGSEDWELDMTLVAGTQYSFTWRISVDQDGGLETYDVELNSAITVWEDIELGGELTISPYKLTKSFTALYLAGDATELAAYPLKNAFDGTSNLLNYKTSGTTSDNGYHTDGYPAGKAATIDLGSEYVLTQFKYWQRRYDNVYAHANLKSWKLWGASASAGDGDGGIQSSYQAVDEDGLPTFEGWTLLCEEALQVAPGTTTATADDFEYYGLTSNGTYWVTPCGITTLAPIDLESYTYTLNQVSALAGHSYEISDTTPIRYIRLEMLTSWNGSACALSELDIFGVTRAEYEAAEFISSGGVVDETVYAEDEP